MKENQKTHMSWLRDNKKMTFVSAIILSIMTVLGTIVLLVVPKPINYEAKDTVSAACILVVITAFGLSAFVVIDRMFVAWYHNRQPDVWERILSLIFWWQFHTVFWFITGWCTDIWMPGGKERSGIARLSVESSGSRVTHSTMPSCV